VDWVEQLIAELVQCLDQDTLKYNTLHDAHYNAARNKCIGGCCADSETKKRFYKILYANLNASQYRHFSTAFRTIMSYEALIKYCGNVPVLPQYGQFLPAHRDHCVHTEDIYLALRLALS
jgi:hypothetical protein